jgi:N-acetylglucosamine kinase-like BadF-type ATPase
LALASVAAACRDALAGAQMPAQAVEVLFVAMAGGAADGELLAHTDPLRELGIPVAPVFGGDALALFCSGTWRQEGYALIAGTGAVAVSVEAGEVVTSADGMGWLLGDSGSGFWIGRRVVRSALAALGRRGPQTALTGLLLADLGLAPGDFAWMGEGRPPELAAAMGALYQLRPVELARFAPLAFKAGDDRVAARIVSDAGQALAATLGAVMDPARPGPVVLGGGTLTHHPELVRRVVEGIPEGAATQVQAVPDGLAGAATQALRAVGVTVDRPVFDRIRESMAALPKL